jgi:hypothetical protein
MVFLVSKDGQQLGPFTIDEVNAHLAGGMLEPSDLGWTEGFEDWYPLEQIEGFVMPGEAAAAGGSASETGSVPVTENPMVTATGGDPEAEVAAGGSGGRRKWIWGVSLVAGLGVCFGAYQFVFGAGSLENLCTVLVEIIEPPKAKVQSAKVDPPHVAKYHKAATDAGKGKTPIDAINEHLDLRGDSHSTRIVSGLTQSADTWFKKFSQEAATAPEAKGLVDLLHSALKSGGIDEVKAHGMSSATLKTNLFRHMAMLHHPTNSTGRLWKELDNNQTRLNGLRLMPQDTVLAIHGRVRFTDLSKWVSELNDGLPDSKLLKNAWQTLKSEVPIAQLQQSWNGEVGLYLTLSSEKFRVSNAARTELRKPGLMIVLGVKDDLLEKTLTRQLSKWQNPERQVQINKKNIQLKVYEKPDLPEEVDKLDLIPSICQAGNYLVLSFAFDDAVCVSALNRHASVTPAAGLMTGTESWAELSGQSAGSLSVPKENLALFLSPVFRDELAKWQKLDLWQDIDPGLQKTLVSLAGSKQDGGMLAFAHVLSNGVLFKSTVHGDSSGGSFQRVKQATRTFLADLVPQLAKLAHEHWSDLLVPPMPKPEPVPKPETPEKSGS